MDLVIYLAGTILQSHNSVLSVSTCLKLPGRAAESQYTVHVLCNINCTHLHMYTLLGQ